MTTSASELKKQHRFMYINPWIQTFVSNINTISCSLVDGDIIITSVSKGWGEIQVIKLTHHYCVFNLNIEHGVVWRGIKPPPLSGTSLRSTNQ